MPNRFAGSSENTPSGVVYYPSNEGELQAKELLLLAPDAVFEHFGVSKNGVSVVTKPEDLGKCLLNKVLRRTSQERVTEAEWNQVTPNEVFRRTSQERVTEAEWNIVFPNVLFWWTTLPLSEEINSLCEDHGITICQLAEWLAILNRLNVTAPPAPSVHSDR